MATLPREASSWDESTLSSIAGIKSDMIRLTRGPRKDPATNAPVGDEVSIVIVEPQSMLSTGAYGSPEGKILLSTPEQVTSMISELKAFRKTFEGEITAPLMAQFKGPELGAKKKEALAPYQNVFAAWDSQIKGAEEALKIFAIRKEFEDDKIRLKTELVGKSTLAEAFPLVMQQLEAVYKGTNVESLTVKIGQLPLTVDNMVALSEMSNVSSKVATAKAKTPGSDKKSMEAAAKELIKTAKRLGLQGALVLGAEAFSTVDADGKSATILQTPTQQIGLHEVEKPILDRFKKGAEHNVKHHGGKRQWLAPILMAALVNGNTDIVTAITESSINAQKAIAFNKAMSEMFGDAYDEPLKHLIPDVLAAVKADGTLDADSKLVQTLETLGRGQGLGMPDNAAGSPEETIRAGTIEETRSPVLSPKETGL